MVTLTAPRRRRRQRVAGDHVADVADARIAAQRERLLPTIFIPLYCLGLCDAVICTPPSRPSRADREVQHVGRRSCRSRRRRRPARVAPSMNAAASAGDDRRMSRADGDALGARDRRRTPRRSARAPSSLTSIGIDAADVVGLEDVGIQRVA